MDLQYKTPKGIEALSIIILLIEIKRYRSATGIDDRQRALFLNIINWIKIIDDIQKLYENIL